MNRNDNKRLKLQPTVPPKRLNWAARSGRRLKGGEVFALVGNLGTGKTHLIKGIALGLEAHDSDQVSSPTFVLVNEYFGRDGLIHIYHIDAYRIESRPSLQRWV